MRDSLETAFMWLLVLLAIVGGVVGLALVFVFLLTALAICVPAALLAYLLKVIAGAKEGERRSAQPD